MGVQFMMQSEILYSQVLQVGNLLHIGQHEACHNWKHGGGYFKHLLEGEDASTSDTKPLIVRSFEINGSHGPNNAGGPHDQAASPNFLESKPSILSGPVKRARESSHIEEQEREKGKKGGAALVGGRKATSVKTKAPKPTPIEPPPKTDYVHVRARRGQATDSHSLAERVRREKISERMRFLQDLVPGCSKITGKAMILEEIINYVQSLQNQVEFLAMRLAAVNPKLDHISVNNFTDEEVKECINMLPRNFATQAPSSVDLQFESLPTFFSGLFDEANFNTPIVSELSTSTCNDSNLTNMDFSHLS